LRLLDGGVDHQVVAGPADHGQRDAGDPRVLLVGAQGRAEVAAAADRLVDGGDAEGGERVDRRQVGAGRIGDDDVQHERVLSLSVGCPWRGVSLGRDST
jgi:hypothetical protein